MKSNNDMTTDDMTQCTVVLLLLILFFDYLINLRGIFQNKITF